jgi:hypothetical protein
MNKHYYLRLVVVLMMFLSSPCIFSQDTTSKDQSVLFDQITLSDKDKSVFKG